MEIIEAELVKNEDEYSIDILEEPKISIPISSDDPNAVKSAFNCLIERLKKGVFSISLKDTDKDLFYHVAKEYLEQLNGELLDVHQEMEQYGFVEVVAQESY
ncbi:hypothetical protein AHAT_07570 [Agarivorans sp. Toyoura001]|uniref:hypothetical protein n=1 Tax=Agarivorans sp. Toyoura001 TaxID=2283141 RepID=UPI0010EF3485|nr:hypothetical protein [Agarivorans sp. Toyoura001]GDY24867.1 hypothetical protein AHAT_07570 [Agarivorans sp. Toyoura001]